MDTQITPVPIGAFPFAGESRAAWEALQRWKNRLLDAAAANPAEAVLTLTTGGALVLYLAEREVNENVRTYVDALHYVATCLTVGYASYFPQTQMGKLVAAIVMMYGPSITNWVAEGHLTRRAAEREPSAALPPQPDSAPVLERLDAILAELRRARSEPER
jgi:hypothetical protein